MNKLQCLEKLLGMKVESLSKDFLVTMDSKKSTKNSLFFAINKGNEYIEEAQSLGAFVIYDDKSKKIKNGYLVENTIEFMQKFASLYRNESKFKVVAITGSNGKTTLKDIIYSVLEEKKIKVYKTQGNFNNHIGMPFTILSASQDNEVLVLELGMSNLGEIDLLASIAKPDYSLITNIGQSHLEFLKTEENVFKAKTEIIKHTKEKVFVNAEDKYLKTLKNVILVKPENIETNLFGNHNKINVSLANALLKELGYRNYNFNNIKLTSGRFEILQKKYRYINDAYNASPLSMKASLETFDNMFNNDFKIIVLGDMAELGSEEIRYHEDLLETIDKIKFDVLMLYGSKMKYLYNKLRKYNILKLANNSEVSYAINWYDDKEEIKKDIDRIETKKKKTILLKASRSMSMEKIMEEK